MCRRLLFRSEKDESRTRTPKGQQTNETVNQTSERW
jgi:hypothetical protein